MYEEHTGEGAGGVNSIYIYLNIKDRKSVV